MTLTFPTVSSSERNVRPSTGVTPRTSKNAVVTVCIITVSGTGRVSSTSGQGVGMPAVAAMVANA
jgi:hypothetical protein